MPRHHVTITQVPRSHGEQLQQRERLYFALMGVCLLLILVAWTLVRLWSTPAAVTMSLIAAVIPPIAAIAANSGDHR
ncbi:DUF3099 domain-containing protein [Nocardioides sp.]|jgi:hypothetical protein|uniref:DUF3099 domain-containing protein n=1 Tax=Nocardioides sp. TaxID=35761 RepID=UPI00261FE63A|nr:DUF3099 domain-containing protein [Nocardioides sp.]